jgi:hypothetical protein
MPPLSVPLFTHWRLQLGLTQPQAGRALGYKLRQIQNFEGGQEPIPRAVQLAMLYLMDHPDAAPNYAIANHGDRRRGPQSRRRREQPDK